MLGIAPEDNNLILYDGLVNFMKAGIECANKVTTVSPTYAKEILDPWYSYGLDPILNQRSWKLCGILNGIDTELYNPETDKMIWPITAVQTLPTRPRIKKNCKRKWAWPCGRMCLLSVSLPAW